MTTITLIDCGLSVIKIELETDHCHVTVFTQAVTSESGYEPAESTFIVFGPSEAQKIIDALSGLVKAKPTLKSVNKDQH